MLTRRLKTDTLQIMNKKLSSIILGTILSVTGIVSAQNINLVWDASTSPEVNRYKVYVAKGTNVVFTAGNVNATTTVTFTNQTTGNLTLPVGTWTFTATALSTNGLESINSTVIWTNVYPGAIINFRFGP